MTDYPPKEIVDMILILGECHNNYYAASRLYAERFPGRRHPNNTTIQRLTQRTRNGHLVRQRRCHDYDENDARAVAVLTIAHNNLWIISTRQIERELGNYTTKNSFKTSKSFKVSSLSHHFNASFKAKSIAYSLLPMGFTNDTG